MYVEGRLQTSSYDDKDGNKRYKTEVIADDVILLSGRGEGGDAPSYEQAGGGPVSMPRSARPQRPSAPPAPDPYGDQGVNDDDVPF